MSIPIEEALSYLESTYKSIEVKGIFFKKEERFINLALSISFSDELPNKKIEKEEKSKLISFKALYSLTQWKQIKEGLKSGKISLDEEFFFDIKATHIESLRLNIIPSIKNESTNWPILETIQSSKWFIGSINWEEVERGAKEFNYPHFASMRHYLLGFYLNSKGESIIKISLPVYAKLISLNISEEIIPEIKIVLHDKLGKMNILAEILDYKSSISKKGDETQLEVASDKEGLNYKVFNLKKIELLNEKDFFKISLIHPKLGEEIEINLETSKISNLKDKPQDIFEEKVNRFLSVYGFSSIRLGIYEDLKNKDSKIKIGSADILAYDRITGTILVISCK